MYRVTLQASLGAANWRTALQRVLKHGDGRAWALSRRIIVAHVSVLQHGWLRAVAFAFLPLLFSAAHIQPRRLAVTFTSPNAS